MNRFVRFAQLKTEFGIPFSRMHIDRLEKADKFPKRVHLGANTVAWLESDIRMWIASRAAERP